jgi:hypothetical protein
MPCEGKVFVISFRQSTYEARGRHHTPESPFVPDRRRIVAVYPRLTAFVAALVLAGALSPSLSAQAVQASPDPYGSIDLSIRFFDKRVYYPESEIPLKVTVSNNTARTWRFKLAEDRAYSVVFEARTPANRLLDAADDYKKALATQRPVFYREMAIEPGEEYSFVESLSRYVLIKEAGSYTIRASLFPELVAGAAPRGGADAAKPAPGASPPLPAALPPILSNVLILSVRPSLGLPPASDLISKEGGELLRPLPLPPDEVVSRTITARQRSRWNEFFLYLDVESLLTRSESRKRAFDRESDEGRRRLVERYKADLQANVVDVDIVTVPSSFEILETRYAGDRGRVRVLEKFQYRGFTMLKEYDYELARRDEIWYIEGYEVLNKGTE